MRRTIAWLLTLAPSVLAVPLRTVPLAAQSAAAAPAPAAPSADSATPTPRRTTSALALEVARLRLGWEIGRVPPADSFARGGRRVAAGDTVRGDVAVVDGPLEIAGLVRGDAIAVHGDVRLLPGGHVTGDVMALDGVVTVGTGAVVDGALSMVRSSRAAPRRQEVRRTPAEATWHGVKVVFGWLAILAAIGIGVLLFAERTLTEVVENLEQRFARAFWIGLGAQLAIAPVLLVLLVALALTVVGILLVPFAIVAYAVAVAGMLTLGLLAVARLAGGGLGRPGIARASARSQHLGALARGLLALFALWLVAAAFTWSPLAGAVLRAVALAVTWVAMTLGLGATLASRFAPRRAPLLGRTDPMAWQTPTPVAGVAAARRPKSVTLERA